jgi:geranylgeranyl diphosphate synthase type II
LILNLLNTNDNIRSLQELTSLLSQTVEEARYGKDPLSLYEPIRYIMSLGGKRIRPLLTLLAHQLWQHNPEPALQPALGVEVFHNFSLMHDDIMDKAPLRRGQPTVHARWNESTAILSGDVMLVKAYERMIQVPDGLLRHVLEKFNQCAAEVCEGQQLDMEFEDQQGVSEAAYLDMIRRKTAVLLGFSLELGGIVAGADAEACRHLYELGINMGIGFQLMDDLLDVYAEQEKFGKQVGGDIIANKKTYLLINARQRAAGSDAQELNSWLEQQQFDATEKVAAVTAIYDRLGIRSLTEAKIDDYFHEAFAALDALPAPEARKAPLRQLMQALSKREK